eukprot:97228-Amphidinium_carterae.1
MLCVRVCCLLVYPWMQNVRARPEATSASTSKNSFKDNCELGAYEICSAIPLVLTVIKRNRTHLMTQFLVRTYAGLGAKRVNPVTVLAIHPWSVQ